MPFLSFHEHLIIINKIKLDQSFIFSPASLFLWDHCNITLLLDHFHKSKVSMLNDLNLPNEYLRLHDIYLKVFLLFEFYRHFHFFNLF